MKTSLRNGRLLSLVFNIVALPWSILFLLLPAGIRLYLLVARPLLVEMFPHTAGQLPRTPYIIPVVSSSNQNPTPGFDEQDDDRNEQALQDTVSVDAARIRYNRRRRDSYIGFVVSTVLLLAALALSSHKPASRGRHQSSRYTLSVMPSYPTNTLSIPVVVDFNLATDDQVNTINHQSSLFVESSVKSLSIVEPYTNNAVSVTMVHDLDLATEGPVDSKSLSVFPSYTIDGTPLPVIHDFDLGVGDHVSNDQPLSNPDERSFRSPSSSASYAHHAPSVPVTHNGDVDVDDQVINDQQLSVLDGPSPKSISVAASYLSAACTVPVTYDFDLTIDDEGDDQVNNDVRLSRPALDLAAFQHMASDLVLAIKQKPKSVYVRAKSVVNQLRFALASRTTHAVRDAQATEPHRPSNTAPLHGGSCATFNYSIPLTTRYVSRIVRQFPGARVIHLPDGIVISHSCAIRSSPELLSGESHHLATSLLPRENQIYLDASAEVQSSITACQRSIHLSHLHVLESWLMELAVEG